MWEVEGEGELGRVRRGVEIKGAVLGTREDMRELQIISNWRRCERGSENYEIEQKIVAGGMRN